MLTKKRFVSKEVSKYCFSVLIKNLFSQVVFLLQTIFMSPKFLKNVIKNILTKKSPKTCNHQKTVYATKKCVTNCFSQKKFFPKSH